ncbi:MAG: alkaline phosphatase family protein [Planctomycetota bacterium]
MRNIRVLALLLVALSAAAEERHVVIISIDGMRPEFYLDPASVGAEAPNLAALLEEGACVESVSPVFPSVTYPNHASLATGVRPARHGILANTIFQTPRPPYWYIESRQLRVPTIWDIAYREGMTTSAIHWPTTCGAKIDVLLPEPEYAPRSMDRMWRETVEGARPEEFIEKIEARYGEVDPKKMHHAELDRLISAATCVAIEEYKPALVLVHVLQVDGAQHEHGRDGEEVAKAVEAADVVVGEIRASIQKAGIAGSTTILVCGDHGFMTVTRSVRPAVALKRAGLGGGSSKDWKVRLHVSGNQAAVYLADPGDDALRDAAWKALEDLSELDGKKLYRMLARKDLDELGANPAAAFAIAAEEGVTIDRDASEPFVSELPSPQGNHGSHPDIQDLHTGLVLWGRGVKKGARLDAASVLDVAPTAARLLGLEMEDVDGRVLEELLEGE